MEPTDKVSLTYEQLQALGAKMGEDIGKAKVLTTADYNWPTTGTPDSVALWLLDAGTYTAADSNVYVRISSDFGSRLSEGALAIVSATDSTYNRKAIIVSWSGSEPVRKFIINSSTGAMLGTAKNLITTVRNTLTSTETEDALSANQGRVLKNLIDSIAIRGAGAPTTSTVGEVGQLYEDGTNGALYQLKSIDITTTPNAYNWEQVGEGGNGATELTSADYNYPTNNPDGVALWLLEPGLYTSQSNTSIYTKVGNTVNDGRTFLVGEETSSGSVPIIQMNSDFVYYGSINASTGSPYVDYIALNTTISQTTGTSTASVMSQNAVSSMVFADPANGSRVQIGVGAQTAGSGGIGIKGYANAGDSIAIGTSSTVLAGFPGSVALGCYARANARGQVYIGAEEAVDYVKQQYTYNSSGYRLLSGLYDPQGDHDAATKGYVDGLIAALEARIAALEGN